MVEASAKGPPSAERRISEMIQQGMPTLARNFPLNIAMELSIAQKKLSTVDQMAWWVRRWPGHKIFIGDRPLLTFPRAPYPCGIPLDDPRLLIALPISPSVVFFASKSLRDKNKIRGLAPSKIARIVNEETIWRSTIVYAPTHRFPHS